MRHTATSTLLVVALGAAVAAAELTLFPEGAPLSELFNEGYASAALFPAEQGRARRAAETMDEPVDNDVDVLAEDADPPHGGPPPPHGGRGGGPPHGRKGCHGGPRMMRRCCYSPRFADDEIRNAFQKCHESEGARPEGERTKRGSDERGRRKHHRRGWKPDGCLPECMLKELGALENGEVNHAIIKNKVVEICKTHVNGTRWLPIVEEAMDNCRSEAASKHEDRKCSSGSLELARCFRRELFSKCPEEDRNPAKECEEFRKNGPPAGPPSENIE